MTILTICQWLEDTRLGSMVRETNWGYGSAQMMHLLGMALFGGAVVMDDLRMLGRLRRPTMVELLDQLLPLKWWGLGVTSLSGLAIFISDATRLYTNPAFLAKVVLLLLVALNARIFRSRVYPGLVGRDSAADPPAGAKLAASLSLLLWIAIISASRIIGFVAQPG
jgi:hypothetical protein